MVDYFTIITKLAEKTESFPYSFQIHKVGLEEKKKGVIKEPIAESLGLCFRKSMTKTILLPMILTDLQSLDLVETAAGNMRLDQMTHKMGHKSTDEKKEKKKVQMKPSVHVLIWPHDS